MRSSFILVGVFVLIVALSATSFAKPWKNIFPLKTTRAEVVKLLGPPTGIDENDRAVFSESDGVVKISWKRSDCLSKNLLLSEKDADAKAVVYQITLEPKMRFRSIDDYEKPESTSNDKLELKTAYKLWADQSIECLTSGGNFACSTINDKTGFGYSDSTVSGVTSIYYFATKEEMQAFQSALRPCAANSEVNDSNPRPTRVDLP